MINRRRSIGLTGEEAAATYLKEKGYEILETNWRCKIGEVDIVAAENDCIVFVEVRSRSVRSLGSFGTPMESITHRKRAKLRRCAEAYIGRLAKQPNRIRFDCIAVVVGDQEKPESIEHIPNAF